MCLFSASRRGRDEGADLLVEIGDGGHIGVVLLDTAVQLGEHRQLRERTELLVGPPTDEEEPILRFTVTDDPPPGARITVER